MTSDNTWVKAGDIKVDGCGCDCERIGKLAGRVVGVGGGGGRIDNNRLSGWEQQWEEQIWAWIKVLEWEWVITSKLLTQQYYTN